MSLEVLKKIGRTSRCWVIEKKLVATKLYDCTPCTLRTWRAEPCQKHLIVRLIDRSQHASRRVWCKGEVRADASVTKLPNHLLPA